MCGVERAIAIGLLCTAAAGGQCAMCYRNAQALGAARGRVLNAGILVMAAPPLLLLGGFAVLVARRRR
jgi:hypothetical protein